MLTFNQYWAWFWSLLPSLVATKKMMVAWRSWAPHTAPQLPVSILRMLLAVVFQPFQQLLWCLSPNLNCIQHWMKSYFVICTQLLHHSIASRSCSSQIEFSNKHSRNRHYHCSNPLTNQSENMFSFTDKDNEIKWVQTIFCFQEWFNNFTLDHLNVNISNRGG